jgi:hypothetical protein
VPGYIIATISLKPVGGIPGDATADQIRLMADLAKDYSFDELRVTPRTSCCPMFARPTSSLSGKSWSPPIWPPPT